MIADVMFDEGLDTFGLSIAQWNEALESIVISLFPELIDEHIRVRFTESYYRLIIGSLGYEGHFDTETQSIFINHWWIDKEKMPILKYVAKILIHEMKHLVQSIQGRLTYENALSHIEKNPLQSWHERPWEAEAVAFEIQHTVEAYEIIMIIVEKQKLLQEISDTDRACVL